MKTSRNIFFRYFFIPKNSLNFYFSDEEFFKFIYTVLCINSEKFNIKYLFLVMSCEEPLARFFLNLMVGNGVIYSNIASSDISYTIVNKKIIIDYFMDYYTRYAKKTFKRFLFIRSDDYLSAIKKLSNRLHILEIEHLISGVPVYDYVAGRGFSGRSKIFVHLVSEKPIDINWRKIELSLQNYNSANEKNPIFEIIFIFNGIPFMNKKNIYIIDEIPFASIFQIYVDIFNGVVDIEMTADDFIEFNSAHSHF